MLKKTGGDGQKIDADALTVYLRNKLPDRRPAVETAVSELAELLVELGYTLISMLDELFVEEAYRRLVLWESREAMEGYLNNAGFVHSLLYLQNDNYYDRFWLKYERPPLNSLYQYRNGLKER